MSINIYEISIPVINKHFKTFSSILEEGKKAVFIQDHQELKEIYAQTLNRDYQLHTGDIFLKLFYYACHHNRKSTILFLFRMYFEIFTESEKMALRQGFYYGKVKIFRSCIIRYPTHNTCHHYK